MWTYDKTLDNYRNDQNPEYYIEIEKAKPFLWPTFYLYYEPADMAWKMIATDKYAALEEASLLIEKLEVSRPWENDETLG